MPVKKEKEKYERNSKIASYLHTIDEKFDKYVVSKPAEGKGTSKVSRYSQETDKFRNSFKETGNFDDPYKETAKFNDNYNGTANFSRPSRDFTEFGSKKNLYGNYNNKNYEPEN